MSDETLALRSIIEDKVPETVKDWDTQLKISLVISMKRIADALEDGLTSMSDDKTRVDGLADLIRLEKETLS